MSDLRRHGHIADRARAKTHGRRTAITRHSTRHDTTSLFTARTILDGILASHCARTHQYRLTKPGRLSGASSSTCRNSHVRIEPGVRANKGIWLALPTATAKWANQRRRCGEQRSAPHDFSAPTQHGAVGRHRMIGADPGGRRAVPRCRRSPQCERQRALECRAAGKTRRLGASQLADATPAAAGAPRSGRRDRSRPRTAFARCRPWVRGNRGVRPGCG